MRLRAGLTLLALSTAGCASTGAAPPKSQLQVREFQTRSYETADPAVVMKALIGTLLDEGFFIGESNAELGVVSASRESSSETFWDRLGWVLTKGERWFGKLSTLEATANVEAFGAGTRVRVAFRLTEIRSGRGKVQQIEEPGFYQAFFSKLDKSLFLLQEKM